MHRIGGLEKQNRTGSVSYDSDNHEVMVHLRAQKVANVADDIPLQKVDGPPSGDVLVVSWGGTYGACTTAVRRCQAEGLSVGHVHLRYLNPFPRNLGDILRSYKRVLIPELNLGQLRMFIAADVPGRRRRLEQDQGQAVCGGRSGRQDQNRTRITSAEYHERRTTRAETRPITPATRTYAGVPVAETTPFWHR